MDILPYVLDDGISYLRIVNYFILCSFIYMTYTVLFRNTSSRSQQLFEKTDKLLLFLIIKKLFILWLGGPNIASNKALSSSKNKNQK